MHVIRWLLCNEGQGEYAEAAVAYEAAGDQDAVVRLNLDKLQSPHKAASMVRKGGSREGAQRLAQYCIATRDYQVKLPLLSILAPCVRPGVGWVFAGPGCMSGCKRATGSLL